MILSHRLIWHPSVLWFRLPGAVCGMGLCVPFIAVALSRAYAQGREEFTFELAAEWLKSGLEVRGHIIGHARNNNM